MPTKPNLAPVPSPRNAPQPFRSRDSIGFLISRVKATMVAQLDARLAGRDITAAQWAILMRLAYDEVSNAAQLCRDSSYDTGSMTRMLDRLEEKGFIERARSQEDRRVVELALTPAGRALFPELAEEGREVMLQMLQGFSEVDQDQLRSLLRRMLANVGSTT